MARIVMRYIGKSGVAKHGDLPLEPGDTIEVDEGSGAALSLRPDYELVSKRAEPQEPAEPDEEMSDGSLE